jgi:hypothetical protein
VIQSCIKLKITNFIRWRFHKIIHILRWWKILNILVCLYN